jgi:drug/metabolite transporter (DMT)-like permease
VLTAATLWGLLGVAIRLLLRDLPLSPTSLAFIRAAIAFATVLVVVACSRPALLRVPLASLPFFAAHGAISIALFYALYIAAISSLSVAVAVVLLYTAPAWVVLFAWRLFGESIQRRTLAALACTFAGAALVAGVADPALLVASGPGVLLGLGAGLAYGLYSIFGKHAVGRHSTFTVLVYALGFGTLFLGLAQYVLDGRLLPEGISPGGWASLALLGVGLTFLPFALYTGALKLLPASTASILSTWEPVVGALAGYLVLGEVLTAPQLLGAGLVLAGVLMLGRRPS